MSYEATDLAHLAKEVREEFTSRTIAPATLFEIITLHSPHILAGLQKQIALKACGSIINCFPAYSCDGAAAVLRERAGYGEIITGSYTRYECHAFLGIGATALGMDTIVDITADQFGGPEIFVGQIVPPWSREPDNFTKADLEMSSRRRTSTD